MLDAPLWKPPSLAPLSGLAELLAASRLELRCRWGKRERVRARHGCRTSTASDWGLTPPCPPRSPLGNICRSCTFGGLRPLAPPTFPVWGRLPVMHVWGLCPPDPPRSPLGKVRRSCASAHGTTSETAFAATPSQISRKLLPRKRLGVPSLPSRGCAEGTLARPPGGTCRGEAPQPVFAYFLLARK